MADDLGRWLRALGFGDYVQAFVDNNVDFDILSHLTAEDLKELGVAAVGDRRKLLKAIAAQVGATQATAEPPAVPFDRAERRQLTVLFSDLVGSTALSTQLDPEDLRLLIRRYQDAVSGAISRYGGHVAQYLGDGVLAYFGWPRAYEDQSERAVRAGLEAVESVTRVQLGDGDSLRARVGIATGQVVVGDLIGEGGREMDAVTGQTPNLAARLQHEAGVGEVVVSDLTRRMLGETFEVADLGTLALKGFAEPVPAWRIVGPRDIDSRFVAAHGRTPTRLCGRDQELALLRDRWARAQAGEGQVVFVSGDAGIGKSRLLEAMRDDVLGQPHIRLRYQCSPYFSNSSLFPVVRQLEHAAGFLSDDDNDSRLDKLEVLFDGDREMCQLFASLLQLRFRHRYGALELSPPQRKGRTLDALVEELLRLSRQRPVLFLFEDAHWIDPTTQELMERTLARIADARVLLLISHRPEWQPPFIKHSARIELDRLEPDAVAEIVRVVAGTPVSEAFVARVATRSDGVPLFAEELTKASLEGGTDAADVPTTLQASLSARLDRLGDARAVAQAAAVIGRNFSYALLSRVVDDVGPKLDDALRRLVSAELVFERGTPPEATYTFKHALVQDAAYESLLRRTRQKYHERIARVLEHGLPDTAEGRPELLAHHFWHAGHANEAAVYWQQAAERAIARSAHIEALNHIGSGLDALQRLSPGRWRSELELELQTSRGTALRAIHGYAAPDVESVYERARALCEELGETPKLFPVIWGLLLSNFVRADVKSAHRLAGELAALAQQRQDDDLRLEAEGALGMTQLHLGDMAAARDHLEAGVTLYDPVRHRRHALIYGQDPGVFCLSYLAWTLWFLGYPDRALARIDEAMAIARNAAHPFSLAFVLMFAARVHRCRRDDAALQQVAAEMIEISTEHGFSYYQAQGAIQHGNALIGLGQVDAGMAQLQEGMAALEATGTELGRPGSLMRRAEGYGATGQFDRALEVLSEAMALVDGRGMRLWDAEMARLQGVFLMGQTPDNAAAAEACFERALSVARHQQAKSLELRAAVGLSQLLVDDHRGTAAREILLPLLNWFTEGAETADLRDAQAVAASLG